MIERFRHYWWVSVLIAAGIVVVTHSLLVKLIADSETKDSSAGSKKTLKTSDGAYAPFVLSGSLR